MPKSPCAGSSMKPFPLPMNSPLYASTMLASLYHRLLASARYDGSFYTNHVSAVLLARLALSEESANWSNVDSLANLKIIDPACGTGTLLMAAMHTIRDRHEKAMGPAGQF